MKSHKIHDIVWLWFLLAACVGFVGCGSNVHRTRALYDISDSGRLPAESVARILMTNAKTYGISISRFDNLRGFSGTDTLEILPGKHRMWLRMKERESVSPRKTTTHEMLHSTFLYFEFEATSGRIYELNVTGFLPHNWSADLIDLANSEKVATGIHTTKLE